VTWTMTGEMWFFLVFTLAVAAWWYWDERKHEHDERGPYDE
jgi:cbb3-type cytochrome oxidase subunit 3